MTTDEAIAEARRRVPVTEVADHAVCEVRLQISFDHANAHLSTDTFAQDPDTTEFYGSGKTAAEAIMAAVADYEKRRADLPNWAKR